MPVRGPRDSADGVAQPLSLPIAAEEDGNHRILSEPEFSPYGPAAARVGTEAFAVHAIRDDSDPAAAHGGKEQLELPGHARRDGHQAGDPPRDVRPALARPGNDVVQSLIEPVGQPRPAMPLDADDLLEVVAAEVNRDDIDPVCNYGAGAVTEVPPSPPHSEGPYEVEEERSNRRGSPWSRDAPKLQPRVRLDIASPRHRGNLVAALQEPRDEFRRDPLLAAVIRDLVGGYGDARRVATPATHSRFAV